MASKAPSSFQITHNDDSGLVTIVLGRETAAMLFARQDAIDFALAVLEHCGTRRLRLDFFDGRAAIDHDHGNKNDPPGSHS